MRHILWFAVMGATACKSPVAPFPDSDDTDPPTPAVETECDDQIDDDGDTLVDCDDDDCASVELCSWATSVDFRTDLFYDANAFAQLGGQNDCTVVTTATLNRDRDEEDCPSCDRVYCGAFAFPQDDCPVDENSQRPTSGCFGFSFDSPTQWTMYGTVPDTGSWEEVAVLTGPGPLTWSATTQVDYEGVDVGDVTTTFTVDPL